MWLAFALIGLAGFVAGWIARGRQTDEPELIRLSPRAIQQLNLRGG